MIRLFVPDALTQDVRIQTSAEQAHYLNGVMRKPVGEAVAVFNGRDGEWRARLAEAGKRACALVLDARLKPQTVGPDIDLAVALVKRARLETIVEKATELGVRRIRLVITQRTNRANLERLQAIAIEAAEQTGRLDVPVLDAPTPLERLLSGWEPGRGLVFCDEAGEAPAILEAILPPAPAAVLIGPEGGFDPQERAVLRGLAFVTPVGLGPRILRADTAAIAALALWQAKVGDWTSAASPPLSRALLAPTSAASKDCRRLRAIKREAHKWRRRSWMGARSPSMT